MQRGETIDTDGHYGDFADGIYYQILRHIHVNLTDLVDARRDDTKKVGKFKTYNELKDYTHKTEKFYPLGEARGKTIESFLEDSSESGLRQAGWLPLCEVDHAGEPQIYCEGGRVVVIFLARKAAGDRR